MNFTTMAASVVLGIGLTGVTVEAPPLKAASFEEAVHLSEALQGRKQRIDYLVREAQDFLNAQDYDSAYKTARHILIELDSSSREARNIYKVTRQKIQEAEEGLNVMPQMK